ncbi:MAG: DoxX family membrane protein [Acidobacteriota bacterium]
MKYLVLLCRILLGVMFVVFGLNGLHPFFKFSQVLSPDAVTWFTIMSAHGYMTIVYICEVLGGALVLIGGAVPLGLIILCPVTVNIILFHMLLNGSVGVIPGVAAATFELVLIYYYRPFLSGICNIGARPMLTREKPVV